MAFAPHLIDRLTAAQVAEVRRLLAGGKPVPPFGDWLAQVQPKFRWDYRHLAFMRAALDDVTAGVCRRLYFSLPIRHGKSIHNTVSYSAYRLERDPASRVLICSYNQRQAEAFSSQSRRLLSGRVPLSRRKDGASDWQTAAGGGVKAVGAGTGLASVNADLILVDDPIGNREDAESQTVRDRLWDWLTNDVMARCEPHTAVTVTGSRWHADDPGGRILDGRAGPWRVIDLPAEAEEGDPLGRSPGDPLWPELRGADWLAEKKTEMGSYGYASLLLGRPRPRSGGMFKWDWWVPVGDEPACEKLVRYWDLAGTDSTGSNDPDYTAGVLAGRTADRRTAVLDVSRFRHSVGRRDQEMAEVAAADRKRYHGRCVWWLEEETGVGGADRTAALVRLVQSHGVAVRTERVSKKKEIRAEPLASACEAGNVLLAPGQWRDALRREAADFPAGKHDDMVDALAGAYNKLAGDFIGTPEALPVRHPDPVAPVARHGLFGVS